MMSRPVYKISGLALAGLFVFAGCTHGGRTVDFDSKLDQRIQQDLDKRAKVAQGNPLYLELVTELNKGRKLLVSGHPKEA